MLRMPYLPAMPGFWSTSTFATFSRPPATVDRESPFVTALHEAAAPHHIEVPMTVGRDGSSDAVSFLPCERRRIAAVYLSVPVVRRSARHGTCGRIAVCTLPRPIT